MSEKMSKSIELRLKCKNGSHKMTCSNCFFNGNCRSQRYQTWNYGNPNLCCSKYIYWNNINEIVLSVSIGRLFNIKGGK